MCHSTRPPRALVIGLGLIGGSWAAALSKRGWKVSAVDKEQASLDQAGSLGWIHRAWLEAPEELDYDLVILALPISKAPECLKHIALNLKQGAIVTDVGSIKTEICKLAEEFPSLCFIGGHPMTGSEKSGITAAHSELFAGYPYVMIPSTHCPEEAVSKFAKLVKDLGAKVVYREYRAHDQQIALVSHVPHVYALALAIAAHEHFPEGQSLEVAGRSFRELTRLVDSSPKMWREIFVNNSTQVLATLKICEEKIQEFRSYLESENGDKIEELFEKAQRAREQVLDRRMKYEEKLGCLPTTSAKSSGPNRGTW